jgi:DNA repair protein RecO (recombination protein O)
MPADHIYRTRGVVLRRSDLGETDRILTLYTPSRGKIRVIGKGVRKPTSRKAGHVELFMEVDLLVAQGRSLDILTQADMIQAFEPLRTDLTRATVAGHAVELLDAFTEDEDASQPLYDLLVAGLGWICMSGDLQRTARYYELRLLTLAGYRPELFHCVICGEPIRPEAQFYSAPDGGVVCPRCAPERPGARSLSLNGLKVLRYLQTRPVDVVEQLTLSERVQKEIERLMYETLTYHLERRLRSAAFLDRLRREEAAARQAADD